MRNVFEPGDIAYVVNDTGDYVRGDIVVIKSVGFTDGDITKDQYLRIRPEDEDNKSTHYTHASNVKFIY